MFCFGLHAPAILFELPVLLTSHHPTTNLSALEYHLLEFSMFGFTAAQLLFLVGVVVVWFLVGRMIDRYGSPAVHQPSRTTLFLVLLKLLAMFLFIVFAAVHSFCDPWLYNNLTGNRVQGLLFLAWSLVSVILPVLNFATAIRSKSKVSERDDVE
jgi:hypothetical protein